MKIVFRNYQSPGDIVAMTGAIRDLKTQYPDYEIAMDTSCPDIWSLNPHISWFSLASNDKKFDLNYPDIHNAGISGRHFSSAFHLEIEKLLGIRLIQSQIWPEIYLSGKEKDKETAWKMFGIKDDYWIINAGYKNDMPLKSWGYERYQEVVDYLKYRHNVNFIQVGEDSPGHTHLPLDGATNLIGKTSLRDYLILAYHSSGSIGPVSLHLHVSAAFRKPCVIIAGGREPYRWEAYPNQRYICTNGLLPCCKDDGCWKNWMESQMHDDMKISVKDFRERVCRNIVNGSAACMDMIKPEAVEHEIINYINGGMYEPL